ncbi:MAG: hypothetical protein V3U65_00645 [Granulosicoccaceae bacterium]
MIDHETETRKRPDNTRPLTYVLFKKYGVKQAISLIRQDVLFDFKHGVDTFRPVSNKSLFNPEHWAEFNRYVPTTFALMDSILMHMSQWIDFRQCDFLDYGSGKGKALIAAARYPFNSLTGVEYSARLHNTATINLQKLGLTERTQLINTDAAAYFPKPSQRLIYIFNSFTGPTLRRCLQNVHDSSIAQQRFIACANPTESHVYEQFFDKIDEQVFEPGSCEVNFYATKIYNRGL